MLLLRVHFVHSDKHLRLSFVNQDNIFQELSVGVVSLLNLLQLSQVIMMGVGAGANICLRLALAHPDKVLGIIAVQPVISAPGMLEQVKGRAVGADLKSGYGKSLGRLEEKKINLSLIFF